MRINSISDLRRATRQGKYAWPGGYECYFIADDGAVICFDCAKSNRSQILDSLANNHRDGWRLIGFDCSANSDTVGDCAHCNRNLDAYGEESSQ